MLPTAENASITLASSPAVNNDDDIVLAIDYTTTVPDAYPISIVTYEIVCAAGLAEDQNPALVAEYLAFAASDSGQELLGQIGYVPLSGELLTQVRDSVQRVIDGAVG